MDGQNVPSRKAEIDKCLKKIYVLLEKYDEELSNDRYKEDG